MKLLVGIPAYNSAKYIKPCLESILLTAGELRLNVVVVDDASTDQTANIVRSIPEAELLTNQENKGAAACNNELITKAAGFDYFLRLDADTVVRPRAIQTLIRFLESNPRVGLVSAGVVTADGRSSTSYFTYYQKPLTWFKEYNFLLTKIIRILKNRLVPFPPQQPFPVKALATTAVLAKMSAVDKVGGFDPKLPFFLEDSDWAKRFWEAGYGVWVDPQASVVHFGGSSDEEMYIMCRNRALASLYRFTAKNWPGKVNSGLLTVSILGGTLLNLLVATLLLPLAVNARIRGILAKNYRSFSNVLKWLFLNHRVNIVASWVTNKT